MRPRRLRFRVPISPRRFVHVTVCDTIEDMHKAIEKCHGTKHRNELGCTIFFPGATDKGCIANMFLNWRDFRPGVIAHESEHAAQNVCAVLGEKSELMNNEALATWTEKLVDAIWIRAQTSPL